VSTTWRAIANRSAFASDMNCDRISAIHSTSSVFQKPRLLLVTAVGSALQVTHGGMGTRLVVVKRRRSVAVERDLGSVSAMSIPPGLPIQFLRKRSVRRPQQVAGRRPRQLCTN
jgi:hypothetical protein